MKTLKEILGRAERLVLPSRVEIQSLGAVSASVLKRTQAAARRYSEVKDVVLGGSFAKGTWLPGEADIDIFVRMNTDVPESRFEEVGLRLGVEATRGYPRGKKFSQHPYIEARVEGVTVNIVPCFAVPDKKWRSAADRSPFHVELIRENLNEEQRLGVRFLKKFMKGVGVYGAEIEKEGFSGYVAEVLVLKLRSFENVLDSFCSLKASNRERLLVLPDPVDEKRDLAAAISNESVARFVLSTRSFLKSPSLQFFTGVSGKRRRGLEKFVIGVTFSHPRLSEDILWGELKRTMRHLTKQAEKAGFRLTRTGIASDNESRSTFLMIPHSDTLSELEERIGPSVEMRKESAEFIKKNSARANLIWAGEDSRLHLLRKREDRTIASLLVRLTKGDVRGLGASPDLAASLRRTAKVLDGLALVRTARRESWLLKGLENIVSDSVGTNPD